jgi:small subunit ribosomal protein S17
MAKKQLIGKVVSDKMEKTVVVQVQQIKKHPKYLRRIRVHKKYKAHDEKNAYQTGDRVVIEESKPLSRDKRWQVVSRI